MTTVYSSSDATVVSDTTVCGASSSVAWPAIIAGGVAAMAVTLGLTLFGSSLGLAVASPWEGEGASAAGVAAGAVVWMVITQWISSGLGGYLAGRLRTRWTATHHDEVFFRDTAHGFLTWCLATLLTAAFLSSAASSMLHAGAKAVHGAGMGAMAMQRPGPEARGGVEPMSVDYYIDTLFRSDVAGAPQGERDSRGEVMRIVMKDVKDGAISEDDKAYLSRLVARRTNISEADATTRVNNLMSQIDTAKAQAKEVADKARKTTASLAIFTFLSMLVGAFIASVAAALGGRLRDY